MSLFQNTYYYNQQLKSFISAFGSLFDQMSIKRWDVNGLVLQDFKVAIDFAPKNKWVVSITERPDFNQQQVQITLPRLAFEITQIKPATNRKLGFNGTYSVGVNSADNSKTKIFNPTPVDLSVNLYAMTKENDEMFQIIEQILPFFNPTLTINYNILPSYNIFKDVPITLNNVDTTDSYTSAIDEQRFVITTFSFSAQTYIFGPIAEKGTIIKDVKISLGEKDTMNIIENFETKVNPITANPGNVYTINNKWTEINE